MRSYGVAVAVGAGSVALALVFFFAGFFVRGWVDQQLAPAGPPVAAQKAPVPSPPAAVATAAPTVAPAAPLNVSYDSSDPARGPEKAPVTIVEFSDFQCPFCKRYVDETLPLILATYGDRVRYVFRDFPVAELHPQAQKAAEAAQCAAEQGKFWEYHDRLFQNQGALDLPALEASAKALGLNEAAFASCLEGGKYAQAVQKDFADGRSYGVTGSPTFFINGRKLVGAQPYPTFQKLIDDSLATASVR